jgi:hypothetical protein
VKVEIPYFDGCPSYGTAEKILKGVLADEGIEAQNLKCRSFTLLFLLGPVKVGLNLRVLRRDERNALIFREEDRLVQTGASLLRKTERPKASRPRGPLKTTPPSGR